MDKEAAQPVALHRLVRPVGGNDLTVDEAATALREAMEIIQSVGTTGIYDKYTHRNKWMQKYFPLYEI